MNVAELPDDSDSSDEDYIPETNKAEDIPSEVDSDGEPEELLSESEVPTECGGKKLRKKTLSKRKSKTKKQDVTGSIEDVNTTKPEENEGDKKKNVDDLWADFMKDTGFRPKNSKNDTTCLDSSKSKLNDCKPDSEKNQQQKPKEKVKITQIFEFAGEEVKVEKEVDHNSAEARLLSNEHGAPKTSKGKRSAGLSGIGSVLSQLGKKRKISTLEKTKLDWDKFKKEEQIEEELLTHNKGKDGYLDRQDFLQRADLRRFEIEKNIRNTERSKRFNSTL